MSASLLLLLQSQPASELKWMVTIAINHLIIKVPVKYLLLTSTMILEKLKF
jgi:hypothetical protein